MTRCRARVRFIRHAQELGFSFREIRELLDLRIDPNVSCADVKAKQGPTVVISVGGLLRH